MAAESKPHTPPSSPADSKTRATPCDPAPRPGKGMVRARADELADAASLLAAVRVQLTGEPETQWTLWVALLVALVLFIGLTGHLLCRFNPVCWCACAYMCVYVGGACACVVGAGVCVCILDP